METGVFRTVPLYLLTLRTIAIEEADALVVDLYYGALYASYRCPWVLHFPKPWLETRKLRAKALIYS